ncbi:MAG TPA: hypothetical protein VMT23_01850 [Candidatus Binatia bacterium]|nr:hypothetical protein [Candidatus Binatia bacterium]
MAQKAAAAPAPSVVYNATPSSLPPNVTSLGFQATQTSEFGDYVHLGGTDRALRTVTVTMSDWALASTPANETFCSNSASNCFTDSSASGGGFYYPITLNIYGSHLGLNGAPDTLLTTKTETAAIPWRPVGDPTCPDTGYGAGFAWRASDNVCYNGMAFNLTFDLSSSGVTLPNDVIIGIAYNTQSYGSSPVGSDGPYNSLNVGVPSGQTASVGSDDSSDKLFWNTSTASWYTDGGASGVGIFRQDTNWTPNGTVAFEITAASLPDVYVDSSYTLGNAGGHTFGYDAFSTIQAAMNAVAPGGTVHVNAGIYSNVSLTGSYNSNVTIQGTGNAVIDGLNLTGSSFNGLTFSGFTFTGDSSGYGNYSVTIDNIGSYANLTFSGDTFDGQSVDQRAAIFLNQGFDGFSLQNDNFKNYISANAADVYSVVFAEAQNGVGNNYTADDNNLTNSNAKNFLEAYRWQNVTYQNNSVNADLGRLLVWSDNTQSLGAVNISGNTSNLTQGTGIGIFYAPSTTATVTGNTVSGADTCLVINNVSSSSVSGNNFSCSTGNSTPQVVVTDPNQPVTVGGDSGGQAIDLSSLVNGTLPQITINTNNATVTIPAGTTVTAGGTWNGILSAPTVLNNSSVTIPTPSGTTTTVATVIEVGAGNLNLTFNKGVRILLPGQAGKLVGFVRNGDFTQISQPCTADSQAAGDALPAGGDCYISVGSDMVVWTKHFTTFVAYSQAPTPTSSNTSSSSTTSSATSGTNQASSASSGSSVLGSSTENGQALSTSAQKAAPALAIAAQPATSKIFGLAWYWWLVILLFIVAGGYLIYAFASIDGKL